MTFEMKAITVTPDDMFELAIDLLKVMFSCEIESKTGQYVHLAPSFFICEFDQSNYSSSRLYIPTVLLVSKIST